MSDGASSEVDSEARPHLAGTPRPKWSLLYIDARRLSRNYLSRQLEIYLPEFSIESASSFDDLLPATGRTTRFAIALAHTHTAHIEEPGVSRQLSLLGRSMPDVPLILLSDADASDEVVRAFRLGVRGYIPTSLPMKDAAGAIRFVRGGGTFIPPSALAASATLPAPEEPASYGMVNPSVRFTARQWEVLQRLWQGKPNKVIAYELEMSESTVKVHVRHMMKRLHARNRTEVVLLTHPNCQKSGNRVT